MNDGSPMSRRLRMCGLIALAVTVAGGGATFWHLWYPGRAFDAQAWQADERDDAGVRQQMADRLVAHRVLMGKKRAEVVEMLGPPRETEYFNDWDMVYRLGSERAFFAIDSKWLIVRLDPGGRVAEAHIASD